jgi:hypothetical protein
MLRNVTAMIADNAVIPIVSAAFNIYKYPPTGLKDYEIFSERIDCM